MLDTTSTSYNFTNLGWEVKDTEYNPYTMEVKGIYWLQIPKLLKNNINNKSNYWKPLLEESPSATPVSPRLTLTAIAKTKVIDTKAKSIYVTG